jgi:hypothetical protein
VVFLGYLTAQLLVEDCEIGETSDGGVFLSEGANNVIVQNNVFTDTAAVYAQFLDQYSDFPEENNWIGWLIQGNTIRAVTKNVPYGIGGFFNVDSVREDWTIDSNTVVNLNGFVVQNFSGLQGCDGTYEITGNTLPNCLPVALYDGVRASFSGNTVTGTYADGAQVTDSGSGDGITIYPSWPDVAVVFVGTTMTRLLEVDPAKLANYPAGFPLSIRRTGEANTLRGVEVIPDASWNDLASGTGYMIYGGAVLNLEMGVGGKFEFVSYTPPTVGIKTWDQWVGQRLSATDIAFCGQQEVNLSPSAAHTFDTHSGVAIGDTVSINLNANVTLEHVPGVLEMSNGVDYVSAGTVTLSATRVGDVLEVTIP